MTAKTTQVKDLSMWARVLAMMAAALAAGFGIWSIVYGSAFYGPPARGFHQNIANAGFAIGGIYVGAAIFAVLSSIFPHNRWFVGTSIILCISSFIAAVSLMALSFGHGWDVTPQTQPQLPWGITVGGILSCAIMVPVYFQIFTMY